MLDGTPAAIVINLPPMAIPEKQNLFSACCPVMELLKNQTEQGRRPLGVKSSRHTILDLAELSRVPGPTRLCDVQQDLLSPDDVAR